VAGLTLRRPGVARLGPGARYGDLWFALVVGGAGALVVGSALTLSPQAACAFVLVVAVIALYQYDRRWGIAAMFALWFIAPGVRRLFGLMTGHVDNDPLSLAPFLATGALATFELLRFHVPSRIRTVLLLAAAGFAVGLPMGLLASPRAAVYAFATYLAGIAGAVFGLGDEFSARDSTLRRVLLFALPPVAVYAILQRLLPLPDWDQVWLDATGFSSIGADDEGNPRVFASLNSPGALAPLLGLSLLCYLTLKRARAITIVGAALVALALALTFVRSAWVALIVAGLAHVVASRGQSARIVLGSGAVVVAATLALAPVSTTAQDVVDRFTSILDREDTSSTERRSTFSNTFPAAAQSPLGHGLGTAGQSSKLTTGGDPAEQAADNGYLGLLYQVGPMGFLLVMGAIAVTLRAAWNGARERAPGQELRLLLFAMLVYLLVVLAGGDEFYGSHGVIFWFIAGAVLAHEYRRHRAS
jgi:putative inorganic carbon (HCO3(-)) transporter